MFLLFGNFIKSIETSHNFYNKYAYTRDENISTSPIESTTFTYSNDGWNDKLTSVNGIDLTYDANGNVLTYGDKEFTWNTGRNLESIVDGDNNYSYTYDENGIRTSKTVNGVTTYYNTRNGVILSQTDGTNTMYFQYDTNGAPLGFIYNGVQYLYITDQMGDVIAITDTTGTVVGNYEYDAWGTVTVSNSDIAKHNPIRYRGYYYDNETGYYYLQSRYYDASICRFINPDIPEIAQMSKGIAAGTNLYTYCNNDSINWSDKSGLWVWLMSGWGLTKTGFNVDIDKKFLSRPFCRSFAKFVVNYYGNRKTYAKMNQHRIEVELWAHAVGFYAGTILHKVN